MGTSFWASSSSSIFANCVGAGLGLGSGFHWPKPTQEPLLLACAVDIEDAHGLAIQHELILDFAFEGDRRRAGQVDAGIFEILAVVDADGNQPAVLGMGLVAGPLENPNGAQRGRILVGDCDLALILRALQAARRQTAQLPLSRSELEPR